MIRKGQLIQILQEMDVPDDTPVNVFWKNGLLCDADQVVYLTLGAFEERYPGQVSGYGRKPEDIVIAII